MSGGGRVRNGWNKALTATFSALVAMDATDEEISDAIGRSILSVRGKRKVLAGMHHAVIGHGYGPSFESPTRRSNDCAKHVAMIACAHGTGFPVLPIDYRRAA